MVAFLAAERGRGLSLNTIDLRRAAICYLHFIAGCAIPTAEAHVSESIAAMRHEAAALGEVPNKKVAATASLLAVCFAGALRRSERAAIEVRHLAIAPRGLRLTSPLSKGERTGKPVTVPLSFGEASLYPLRALERWRAAAEISEGGRFRRI